MGENAGLDFVRPLPLTIVESVAQHDNG